jgi:hypothetical protein
MVKRLLNINKHAIYPIKNRCVIFLLPRSTRDLLSFSSRLALGTVPRKLHVLLSGPVMHQTKLLFTFNLEYL